MKFDARTANADRDPIPLPPYAATVSPDGIFSATGRCDGGVELEAVNFAAEYKDREEKNPDVIVEVHPRIPLLAARYRTAESGAKKRLRLSASCFGSSRLATAAPVSQASRLTGSCSRARPS